MSSASSSSSSAPTAHQIDPSLLQPYSYISTIPGKNIREKLIDCFNVWLCLDCATTNSIKEIVSQLHNASLLIDDIEDGSKLRRGVPVAHSIFGIAQTINTSNYVYFMALEKVNALNNPKAMNVFVAELLNLHRGQGQDILWRDTLQCPTEAQYERMVLDKTGGLFRLAVGLMVAFASSTAEPQRDFTRLVDRLALYFQIRDDLVNLASSTYMKDKGFCEDLTEGKFSFPIIHCVRAGEATGDTKLLSILKQKTEEVEVKKFAQLLMRQSGSLEYTRRRCSELKEEVLQEIEACGGHDKLAGLICALDAQIEGVAEDEGRNNTAADDVTSPPKSPPMPSPPNFSRIDSASN
jgi:geranylgeranyl diphosphate synthase type 3